MALTQQMTIIINNTTNSYEVIRLLVGSLEMFRCFVKRTQYAVVLITLFFKA